MNLLKSVLLIAAFVSTQSFAALQTVHWKTSGDSLATLDTVTGKDWLDLTQADGRSIDYAMSQLGAGGVYAGWRLPTQSEVLGLTAVNKIIDQT